MADENTDVPKGDDADDSPAKIADQVARLLEKHGNKPDEAMRQLLDDNFSLRQKRRADREKHEAEIAELKKKLPAEGSVILTGDDAKLWGQLAAAEGGVASFKDTAERAATAEKRLAEIETNIRIKDLAGKGKLNPTVLADCMSRSKLTPDDIEVKDTGTARVPAWKLAVKATGEDGKAVVVPLERYAEQNWADYLPALKVGDPGDGLKSRVEFRHQADVKRTTDMDRAVRQAVHGI
jgi:hypothetical protein